MAANFMEILNVPFDSVKPPMPLPMGTYTCIVDGQPDYREMGAEQNTGAIFKLKPIQAGPDVVEAELIEALDGKALSDFTIQTTFWITPKAMFRLTEFLSNALGIEGKGRQVPEMIPDAAGRTVNVMVTHRPAKDGKTMYMEAKSFARV